MKAVEARQILDALSKELDQPNVKAILGTLEETEQNCLVQIVDFRFDTMHDVCNHFALIGEIRGLRRFMHEVRTQVAEMQDVITEEESAQKLEQFNQTTENQNID